MSGSGTSESTAISPLVPSPTERGWPVGVPHAPRDEPGLRSLICHVARLMHQFRLCEGAAGVISARLSSEREGAILVTPAGVAKSLLQPDQLIRVDLNGARIGTETDANRALQPDPELSLILTAYRVRAAGGITAGGVIHAHPPLAVALTLAGVSLRRCLLPEAVIALGLVPTIAYAPPNHPDALHAVQLLIAQHDALLLAAHGSLTVGADVWQAYLLLETLEHTATILHAAAQLGPLTPLSPDQVAALLTVRRERGLWRETDAALFCEACGAC